MNWVHIIQCVTTTRLLSSLSLPTFVNITYKVIPLPLEWIVPLGITALCP